MTRALLAQAAARGALDPERRAWWGCLQSRRKRRPGGAGLAGAALRRWYVGRLGERGRPLLPPRANRVNPRVLKRQMAKFKKKRPEHRPVPPLRKTSTESVVMLV